jgi:NAD(P)-dependent dehydrogenase (short-subunit alcohol dehydrogenase family)
MDACLQIAEDVTGLMSLNQKVILITGANRGIGKEIAKQMAEKGWHVIVTARDYSKAVQVATEIGTNAWAVQMNVQEEDTISEAASMVDKKFGKLDALVNNAGVIGNRAILDFDLKQISGVMDTNVMGPIRTSKYFMPLLKRSEDARIINISSGMGEMASFRHGGYGAYRLSKATLNSFSMLLASELSNTNVRVFSMCPGWVRTEMGGEGAPRSVETGAETAVWLATDSNAVSGRFYRDKKMIDW